MSKWTKHTWVGILVGAVVSVYEMVTGSGWVNATTVGTIAGVAVWAVLEWIVSFRYRRREQRMAAAWLAERKRAERLEAEKPRLRGI